ncbi:MAG TPA: hypothetical protein ENN99_10215 [Chloroflexi bacterium]|nr:hypothetical protein [Chloroflexota bacterium]
MIENGELPAWLTELRDQQVGQQHQEPRPPQDGADFIESLQAQVEEPVSREPAAPEQQVPKDVLDDLREQIKLTEDDYVEPESTAFYQPILNLPPAQRMVLSILLFLNAVLCGCMALVMAGRVVLPF